MLIGLSLLMIGIFSILIFAIQNNMRLFFASSNRTKAFYDAEVAIEKMAVKLRDAYDLARPVAKNLTVSSNPAAVVRVIADPSNLKINDLFYLPGQQFCVDRSDGFGNDQNKLCLNYNATDISPIFVNPSSGVNNWDQTKEAFQFAILKLIRDLTSIPEAEAQEMTVYRPTIPNTAPKVLLNLGPTMVSNTGDLVDYYDNYTCTSDAGPMISHCVRFRFCLRIDAAARPCSPEEFVYQTIAFRPSPVSDVEN